MSEPAKASTEAFPLTSPVLLWACYDPSNLVTVVINQYLKGQVEVLNQRLVADLQSSSPALGLVAWAIHEPSHFPATLTALLQARKQNSPALLLVFLVPELLQYRSALIEAGAHFVVQEISQIPSVLSKCFDGLTISREGKHPITSGLVNRLPWAFADKD